jgi:hypothetical protein
LLSARRPRQPAEHHRSRVVVWPSFGRDEANKQPVSKHSKSNSQSERPWDAAAASPSHRKPYRQHTTRAHLRPLPPSKTQRSRAARNLTRRSLPLTPATHPASSPTRPTNHPHCRHTACGGQNALAVRATSAKADRTAPQPRRCAAVMPSGRPANDEAAKQPVSTHSKRNSQSEGPWDAAAASSSHRKQYRQQTTCATFDGFCQLKPKAAEPRAT